MATKQCSDMSDSDGKCFLPEGHQGAHWHSMFSMPTPSPTAMTVLRPDPVPVDDSWGARSIPTPIWLVISCVAIGIGVGIGIVISTPFFSH